MKLWQILLSLALLVGVVCSPLASRSPDGLERVAIDYGFIEKGEEVLFVAPVADYRLSFLASETAATAGAGLVGVLVVFSAMVGVGVLLGKR